MHTVVSYPPQLSSRALAAAGLVAEYLAFDHLRSCRRDAAKVGYPMAIMTVIAGAAGRVTPVECGTALALFTIPPAILWTIEQRRWRRLAQRMNHAPEKVIRKS